MMRKRIMKAAALGAAICLVGVGLLQLSPAPAEAAASSFRFTPAFTGIQARLLYSLFETATGHRHNGTDSRKINDLYLPIVTKTAVGSATGLYGVYASSTIPATTGYETVISSGLLVLLTSTPNISTTTAVSGATPLTSGTHLVITSTAAVGALIFQDEGTLTGSLLELGGNTRTVGRYDILELVFDATDGKWREVSYTDN